MPACAGDGADSEQVVDGTAGQGGSPADSDGFLVIVTERESPETSLQYLHVRREWPDHGALDYKDALELGPFVSVQAIENSVFVQFPDDGLVRKLVFDESGRIATDETISFARHGITASGDMVYASRNRAYFIDEAAGLIVIWDPETMAIVDTKEMDEGILTREGMSAQVSRGPVLGGEGFVSFSWRDWETLSYHDAAAIGVFDATSDEPELEVIEDDRCASTVTVPFDGGDGFVYLVSDAALGFDALANPKRTEKTLCVLRIRPGERAFDTGFMVDLGEVLESPGFYVAHPMREGKLLVNAWSPEVPVSEVADPGDPSWYWDSPPYYEFSIVDLKNGTSVPVKEIPRAAVQWSVTLRVEEDTFVQAYRDDGGSDLYLVGTDASIVKVLSNGRGTDVQYLGRIRP